MPGAADIAFCELHFENYCPRRFKITVLKYVHQINAGQHMPRQYEWAVLMHFTDEEMHIIK